MVITAVAALATALRRGCAALARKTAADFEQTHRFWVYRARDATGPTPQGQPVAVCRTEREARQISGMPLRIWSLDERRWLPE